MQPALEGGAARLGCSSNGSQQESSHLDTWVGGGDSSPFQLTLIERFWSREC